MSQLINKIKNLINNIESNIFIQDKDKVIINDLIELLYDHTNGNLLPYFMLIDKISKDKHKKELNEMYQGLQDGMHSMASLSSKLLENKSEVKAKNLAKYYFRDPEGFSSLINIAKAYFRDGTSKGCSWGGKWWFDNFLSILKEEKNKYLEGGSSHNWAKNYNHLEYIKLVLEKNK